MDHLTEEKRRTSRSRVVRGGVISFPELGTTLDCRVYNLSEAGACLVATSRASIPNEFELVLDNVLYRCRVIWRKADRLGVEFQAAPLWTRSPAI